MVPLTTLRWYRFSAIGNKDFYTNEDHLLMQKIVEKLDALSHSNYSLDKTQKEQIKQFKEKVELLNSCAAANSL